MSAPSDPVGDGGVSRQRMAITNCCIAPYIYQSQLRCLRDGPPPPKGAKPVSFSAGFRKECQGRQRLHHRKGAFSAEFREGRQSANVSCAVVWHPSPSAKPDPHSQCFCGSGLALLRALRSSIHLSNTRRITGYPYYDATPRRRTNGGAKLNVALALRPSPLALWVSRLGLAAANCPAIPAFA